MPPTIAPVLRAPEASGATEEVALEILAVFTKVVRGRVLKLLVWRVAGEARGNVVCEI